MFAILHVKAFSYTPYRPFHPPDSKDPPPKQTPRLRSLGHAFDFRETFREIGVGCIYIYDKMRGKEPTPDLTARRAAYYEEAFGRPRPSNLPAGKGFTDDKMQSLRKSKSQPKLPVQVGVEEQVEVDVEGERQWLGLGDDYGYGLGYMRREKSDSLGLQIEHELEKRGYTTGNWPAS